jgi:hypothetical protein
MVALNAYGALDEIHAGDLEGARIGAYRSWRNQHTWRDRLPRGESIRGGVAAARRIPVRILSAMASEVTASGSRSGRQSGRVALPRSGLGASRPRARARATASARVCVPSLSYR